MPKKKMRRKPIRKKSSTRKKRTAAPKATGAERLSLAQINSLARKKLNNRLDRGYIKLGRATTKTQKKRVRKMITATKRTLTIYQ